MVMVMVIIVVIVLPVCGGSGGHTHGGSGGRDNAGSGGRHGKGHGKHGEHDGSVEDIDSPVCKQKGKAKKLDLLHVRT